MSKLHPVPFTSRRPQLATRGQHCATNAISPRTPTHAAQVVLLALATVVFTFLLSTVDANATPILSKVAAMAPPSGNNDSLPIVLITNADKLNGYIALKDFTSHFASYDNPYPPPADTAFVHQNQDASTTGGRRPSADLPLRAAAHTQHEYTVYCTVSDPDSPYTDLAKRLGCHTLTLSHEQRSQRAEWERVFTTLAAAGPARSTYLLWVPDIHDHSGDDLTTALAAAPADLLTHAVVWSRNGAQGPLTDDLVAFGWYRAVERAALASALAQQGRLTVLRLSFALERFLDLAADIEDESALRLPIGAQGQLIPISLHDAVWAAHTLFQAAARGGATPAQGFKPIMHLTTRVPVTGADLAAAASRAFGYPVRFEAISPAAARDLLMSLENVTPQLAQVLLDVFECARRTRSGCHVVASEEEVKALLPGRQVRPVEWFFQKYRDMFSPGGGI